MEILSASREKSSLTIAVVAVLFLGLGLSASAWQNLSRQRQALDQHLYLAAASVHQTIRASLWRNLGMRIMDGSDTLAPAADELFQEIESGPEVVFVAALGRDGKHLSLATEDRWKSGRPTLGPDAMQQLRIEGKWHGVVSVGDGAAYVLAQRLRLPPRPPMREGMTHRMGMPGGAGRYPWPEEGEIPEFLIVGLDMQRHLALYTSLKRSILFTVGYTLLAAVLLMGLALAVVRRRGAARRVESLERLQAKLLDAMPEGLLLVDGRGVIQAANPAAHGILGLVDGALAGRDVSGLPLPRENGRLLMNEWVYYEIGHEIGHDTGLETGREKGDQPARRCLEILALPLPEGAAPHAGEAERNVGMMVFIRDRTQLKNLEQNLAEAQKLAALGTLAAGVAHEVRNPLSALRGFAQFFAKKFAGRLPEETYALTMVREADRLNRVVGDLLHLARPRVVAPRRLSVSPLVDEVVRLVRQEKTSQDIQIETDLQTPEVFADGDGLTQALLNLGLNALEATSANKVAGAKPRLIFASRREDRGVVLSVRDNGPGMDEESRRQAFEPFFTTKATGTGLGLALVHKLAREHGGRATILSRPGQGTSVELYFPDAPRTDNTQAEGSA